MSFVSTSSEPALGGHRRRVDEVDRLLGVTRENADEHGDPQQPGVVLGDASAELGLDAADRSLVEALCQPPQPLAQRHERHQRLRQRGVDVDRVGHDGAREGGAHLLGRVDARAVLRLRGGGAEVRGDDHVVALEDRMIR